MSSISLKLLRQFSIVDLVSSNVLGLISSIISINFHQELNLHTKKEKKNELDNANGLSNSKRISSPKEYLHFS